MAWAHTECLYGPRPEAAESLRTDDLDASRLRTEAAQLRAEVASLKAANAQLRGLDFRLKTEALTLRFEISGLRASTARGATVIGEDRLGKVLNLAMRAGTDGEALAALCRQIWRGDRERGSSASGWRCRRFGPISCVVLSRR